MGRLAELDARDERWDQEVRSRQYGRHALPWILLLDMEGRQFFGHRKGSKSILVLSAGP